MHLDELRARLRAMQAPRLDDVAALALPCLALHSRHPTGGSRTRLGGLPELPIGQPWPRSAAGTPMTFVGQLDLAELSSTPLAGELPGRGILGWFYGTQATSERPEFATTFAVDPDATHRAEAPDGTELVAAREVTMRPAWSLPPSNCDAFLHRFDDQADRNAYGEFRDEWDLDDEPHGHRLFGYASALDDPYVGTALDVDPSLHERWFALSVAERAQKRGGVRDELMAAACKFRLCATFWAPDMDWADGGSLSFLLARDAWQAGRFRQDARSREAAAWCQRS